MRYRAWASFFALAWVISTGAAQAQVLTSAGRTNCNKLSGTLLDYTINSGCNRRTYCAALDECRDLYVYLPPDYDPDGTYPLLIWLHGYTTDERVSARHVVPAVDRAIVEGRLPPLVLAAPDGSLGGNAHFVHFGSWYVNSRRGRFADYIMHDVLEFLEKNFAITSDCGGRAIAGFSMGGFGAYNLGMKHPDKFRLVAGVSPALSLRYAGRGGRYSEDFDPDHWSMRSDYRPHEIVGRFYWGLLKVRAWQVVRPVWGSGPAALERLSGDNPIEMLMRTGVPDNQQKFYVGYGKRDELNIDAQVESFLHVAGQHGAKIETHVYPCGDHSISFMVSALPDLFDWLKRSLADPMQPVAK